MEISNLIPGLVIIVIWLAVCCVLIGKWIKNKKVTLIVVAVILFILSAGIFAGARIGASIGGEALHKNITLVEELLAKKYGNMPLVRTGVDASDAPKAIKELEAMVPQIITSELGLSGLVTETMYKSVVTKGFDVIREKADTIAAYANENGKITASSIIRGLEQEIQSLISKIVFRATLVMFILMAVYLIICGILALKSRKTASN